MSSRVLIVDDIEANRKVLEAKLLREYYTVSTASSGLECLDIARETLPDIILLDVMMPGMDGFETCRRLKSDPETEHIPVVMVTALHDREDRLKGLGSGADDFLTKPVAELPLLARVRALTRYKLVVDELRRREASGRALGVIEGVRAREDGIGGRILIVDTEPRQVAKMIKALGEEHVPFVYGQSDQDGLTDTSKVDLLVISIANSGFDGLKLVAHFRSQPALRDIPIIVIGDDDTPEDNKRLGKVLELGAADIITRPIDPDELKARVKTQLRRKRYMDMLRERLDSSMELAVTDQLTGLHNRRYMNTQLNQHLRRARIGEDPVSVIVCDIDFFKKVNDCYGHDVGDEALKEFSNRLLQSIRPGDIACRMGGEEFIAILPETRGDLACSVAERIRRSVAGTPFRVRGGKERINVTVSLGVATSSKDETIETLIKRADQALYRAKDGGRNRVEAEPEPDLLFVNAG
jgi:two-component system, cell cycle response regulator